MDRLRLKQDFAMLEKTVSRRLRPHDRGSPRQIGPDHRIGIRLDLSDASFGNDATALAARLRAHLDDPVGLSQDVDVMIDEKDRVAVRHQVVHQRKPYDKDGTSSAPDLLYATVTVKFPMLYDWCKNQLYYSWDETNSSEWPVGNRMVFQKQDPAPWKAEEVYRLYSEEGWWTNTYLLCYEKRIISIRFDWEPTEAQMAIVSQKLNP